jgi:hypothetical protein
MAQTHKKSVPIHRWLSPQQPLNAPAQGAHISGLGIHAE